MTIDPKTHRLYLSAATIAPVPEGQPQPQGRRNFVPGSFVVLVVGEWLRPIYVREFFVMSRTIALFCILICHFQLATAQEAEVSDEQIDRLISELVSPNEAPKRSGPFAVYPEGYDKEAQRKVSNAHQALRKLGPQAFHRLFNHFDDKRFCMNGDGGEAQINKTVGQVCVHLVDCQLEPYSALGGPGSRFSQHSPKPPNYFAHFKLREPKNAHEWWETRKNKSLKELQIEVLEWVISEEEKLAEKYSDKDRDNISKKLDDLRMQENPIQPAYLFAR